MRFPTPLFSSCRFVFAWNALLTSFWSRCPALYLALFFLTGITATLTLWSFLGAFFFTAPKRRLLALAALGLGYSYFSWLYPAFPQGKEEGAALVHIERIQPQSSFFKPAFVYEATLKQLTTQQRTMKNLPCRLYVSKKMPHPLKHSTYYLAHATLTEPYPYHYLLKPAKKVAWTPVSTRTSLAHWRYQCKEKLRNRLHSKISHPQVASLLAALVTGDLDHALLAFQFRQIGLQHLLVVSGFHFAILGAAVFFLARLLLSKRAAAALSSVMLTAYAFCLGPAPSLSRAWIAALLFLIARYFSYRFSILNALGLALLIALLKNPLIVVNLGFQLSFAATLGILLLYAPLESAFSRLLLKRSFQEALSLPFFDRIGYLITTYLRQALALQMAVTLFTLPLLLAHFHTFSLLSMLYNLFFPLIFSPLLLLAFLTLAFSCLAPITLWYAKLILALVTHAPRRFAVDLCSSALTPPVVTALFCILLVVSIAGYTRKVVARKRLA